MVVQRKHIACIFFVAIFMFGGFASLETWGQGGCSSKVSNPDCGPVGLEETCGLEENEADCGGADGGVHFNPLVCSGGGDVACEINPNAKQVCMQGRFCVWNPYAEECETSNQVISQDLVPAINWDVCQLADARGTASGWKIAAVE